MTRYERSAGLHADARKWIAGGVNSNFRSGGTPQPLFFRRAEGCHVHDVDGNEYIDYVLGMGPAILGHTPERMREAVRATLDGAQLYAGQIENELALAQLLCDLLPVAERVRFSTTGSEAVQAAMRLARAATGRNRILKFEGHYHGWLDGEFVSVHPELEAAGPPDAPHTVPGSIGQPASACEELVVARWNDADHFEQILERHGAELAAVMMEPIMCNTAVVLPRPGYLDAVRELTRAHGALLIFDEVITGFRVDLRGAQGLLGVTPDLAIYAKALGGGFPVSCLAGSVEVMELAMAGVLHGGTYNSQAAGVAAALATVRELADGEALDSIRRRGETLIEGIQRVAEEIDASLVVQGVGSVFHTNFGASEATDYRSHVEGFDLAKLRRFVRALQDRGVRITLRGTWFVSAAHTDADVDRTLEAIEQALVDVRDGVDALANA